MLTWRNRTQLNPPCWVWSSFFACKPLSNISGIALKVFLLGDSARVKQVTRICVKRPLTVEEVIRDCYGLGTPRFVIDPENSLFIVSTKQMLGFRLPWVIKAEFLLTISISIKQTSDENKEEYKSRDNSLIQDKIMRTNIIRIVWQTVRRISSEILRVKRPNACKSRFDALQIVCSAFTWITICS